MSNDPYRDRKTRLEILETPLPKPEPVPEPKPIVSESTETALNARIEAIRRPGAGAPIEETNP